MQRNRRRIVEDDFEEPSTSQQFDGNSLTGKIKSVYCKDFVTYAECTFYPTEYLNVIIGPNGTGKSTLVAAIVLGLGGKPELLSRSNSIADYVKNGREEAVIRVEIHRETLGKWRTFQRRFTRSGKSEFKVDAEVMSERNFLSAVAQYHIQISNLCQFLPQDRVQDFAKMDPQTIFVNTVKSVCSKEVVESYEALKAMRAEQMNENDGIKKNSQRLADLQSELDKMQADLQLYNEQQDFRKKLNVCEAKKLQLQAQAQKEDMEQCAVDLRLAKSTLEEAKNEEQEILRKQAGIIRAMEALKAEMEEKRRLENTLANDKSQIEDRIRDFKNKITEARTNYMQKEREKISYDRELQTESNVLQAIIQDLSNAKSKLESTANVRKMMAEYDEALSNLKERHSTLMRMHANINTELDEHAPEIGLLKRRMEQANNIKEQKLHLMREKFPDVYKAVQWLRSNRDKFEGHVYDPMLLELNVRNANYAKYFENTIAMRDLQSFICENKADVSRLVDELRLKQNLSINVAYAPPADKLNYAADVPISDLKSFGFTSYLIDLIDGPPAILNYLCSMNALHRIPVGNDDVNKHTDIIPTKICLYFGGDQRYAVSVSKYTNEPSIRQNRIKSMGVLCSVDVNELRRTEQKLKELVRKSDYLKNQRSALESQISDINVKYEEMAKKKRHVTEKISLVSQLEDKCRRQKAKVVQLKENTINLPELEQKCAKTIQQCLQEIMNLQAKKINKLEQLQRAVIDKKCSQMKIRMFELETERHRNEKSEVEEKVRHAQLNANKQKEYFDAKKRNYESTLAEMKKAKKNCSSLELFNELPDDLEELQDAINEYRGRLECMNDINQEIVTSYEQKCAEVEQLKTSIETGRSGHRNLASRMAAIHEGWYPQIEKVVQTLNSHFGDFMTSMGYVGQVNLTRSDVFDYNSYGIQIMVQYRENVPLQALDRHVQSGGERAVAIATYTLSLQHITHVPFRCVDEINQGMDARNERKIFEMLVKETTQIGRSQYFFITPKLLPNLSYNERMTVHIVFNGKMIQSVDVFSSQI